jgi:hypothetical protein
MSDNSFLKQALCYISTPEHVRSFYGSCIYIYTGKGELFLSTTTLRFVGKKGVPLEISLNSITGIDVGHYSRLAKPIRLDYMAVRYRDQETERTTLFTPTSSWSWVTPVWETNKIVADRVVALQAARSAFVEPRS